MSNNREKLLYSKTLPSKSSYALNSISLDKSITIENKLDHNNMIKSLQKKQANTLSTTIKIKDTPIKPYPGVVEVKKRGAPTGAIYYDDLIKEEMELNKLNNNNVITVLSSEELMRDKEYLKIDQSKLPIEIFDNLEYEMNDKPPSEWIATGCNATSPFYRDGNWIWRQCKVLSYDDTTQLFQIKFLPDGLEKHVKRLNIKFDLENSLSFDERRNSAEEFRNEAKSVMRLDYFITQQPNYLIHPIRKDTIKSIHEKVIDGLPLYLPFPEQGTPLGLVLRNLTADVIQWYTRTVKKTVLYTQITNPIYENKTTKIRFIQLHLPNFPPKPKVPRSGKIPIPDYPFHDRCNNMSNLHYSRQIEVLNVYRWISEKFMLKFQSYNFFITNIEVINIPSKLENYRKIQHENIDKINRLLQKDFRRSFMDQLLDYIQDIYDFFQSNITIFKTSILYKLFRVLDLKLSNILRYILYESIDGLIEFINKYTYVKPMISSLGNIEKRKSVDFTRSNSTAATAITNINSLPWRRTINLRKRDTELNFAIYSENKSLFLIEIVINNNKIELEPSIDDIIATFHTCIDKMITSIRSITSVDNDIMSLLTLDTRVLCNINVGDPLVSDIDSYIRQSKSYITNRITTSMEQSVKLCKLLSNYIWLINDDIDEYIEKILTKYNNTPNVLQYYEELDKLDITINNLIDLSFNNENFSLVQISLYKVKNILINKAIELKENLYDIIKNDINTTNKLIINKYTNILERIAKKPINEKELSELREFIIQSKDIVIQLTQLYNNNKKLVELLYYYNVLLNLDDMKLHLSILEYPNRVDSSGKEMEILLENDKIKMMDRLAVEKENFEKKIENIVNEFNNCKLLDNYNDREKIFRRINLLSNSIEKAKEDGVNFNMREKVFGFIPTDYSILDKLTTELSPFSKLWNMVSDFYNSTNDWLHGNFKDLDSKLIEENILEWYRTSYKLSKSFEEQYKGISNCALLLRNDIEEFRKHLPIIQSLASKALQRRHWDQLSSLLGTRIDPERDDTLTLQRLLDLNVNQYIESISDISMKAEKEFNLENSLKLMKKEWETIDLELKPYKDTGSFVIGGIDEIIALLDDHIVKTQTMRGSPYIKPIEEKCKKWELKLKYAQVMLDELIQCQRTWMYLEPIFSSEDIMRQLPTEARRFNGVDSLWKKTMNEFNSDSNFMIQSDVEKHLDEKFKKANKKLDEITKGLNDYLETKRLFFPRFFFLSNDELLEILSQTKEPRAVQPHLGKCFEGIHHVQFESDLKISAMISIEGEVIKMDKIVDPETPNNKGNVEKWLLEIESIQWESIRSLTIASIEEYNQVARKDWILHWPAQVILGVSCLYWTMDVTLAFESNNSTSLMDCNQKLDYQLREMVELVRGPLTSLARKTLGALTTIDVHNRDVVSKMVELGTSKVTDFEWISQLRYYWEDSWKDGQAIKKNMKTLVARIVNAKCLYGYEYLGNTTRLVITALTDRCYRTMIGAVDLLYGGAPEGPAGTGKTETVKDLSKAVAIQCVVFNCSDGLDYLAMAKFFKGLAGCGSWCCFDEFNRINIEVLSVIAQQILIINQAKKENKEMFHFEGTYMKINSNCNVFITMNPGYAGRAELPDNLKALFRPCAMMVPDYAMIGEIRLYSYGFETARENAQKIVRVLQLSSEQLSSQMHYDYGMRAVNSILIAAGNLRFKLGNNKQWTEAMIILRSINDVNLAKFLVEDIPLFQGITSDLFPGVKLPEADYETLLTNIHEVSTNGIEIAPDNVYYIDDKAEYNTKVIQLYEMVLVRHGVMVVGQTCSGKTAIIHTLAKAMTLANSKDNSVYNKVVIYTINPKSVTSGQLYGLFDENTHEFVDGILAVTFRKCAKDTSSDRKWIMFDGPVDAVWIENMNTVLDDNKKLCLNSGEIIKMSDNMTMMFETEDLDNASPATVSRVGMIFCETRNIGYQSIITIWCKQYINAQYQPYISYINELFDWLYPVLTSYIVKYCKQPVLLYSQELIFSLLKLLNCLFDSSISSNDKETTKLIDGFFVFAFIWSIGVCIDYDSRIKFDKYIRLLCTGKIIGTPEYEDYILKSPEYPHRQYENRSISINLPEEGLLYDYIFDHKTMKWINWLEFNNLTVYKIPNDSKYNNIVIPTIDTVRNEWLIEKLLLKGYHVLCTGETGTGKSILIKNKLQYNMPENYNSISLNFSAQSTANQTQDFIDSKLDKRRKGVLGPPLGIKTIIFIDDLNMPEKEEYGAQPPIEILRQWMDHKGWYDRKENEFRRLVDIQFITAMGPPGGGRTSITKRYIRHFNVINFVNFSDISLTRVFGTILDWHLSKGFSNPIKQLSSNIIECTIHIYNTISSHLLPTPAKSHYTFNLRDLSKVFQGIVQSESNNIKEKETFIKLWLHECLRVFSDRLIDQTDKQWYIKLLDQSIKDYYRTSINLNDSLPLFGIINSNRSYIQLSSDTLSTTVTNYLTDYNQINKKPLSLVLFQFAIEHICRITRIINLSNGNALLVGVGGSGRKSLTVLSIYISEYELFQIEITKSYNLNDWRNDMKTMMHRAGISNKSIVFLLDDTQIVKEQFLEDINSLLNISEITNLFNNDDYALIYEGLIKTCQDLGINTGSINEIYSFYLSRIKSNLHIVICLSPIGELYRTRLRKFPSLVNCCTIDWFNEWPTEALRSVAYVNLKSISIDDVIKDNIIDICVNMQEITLNLTKKYLKELGRYYYITPTSYLELINIFKTLLFKQRNEIFESKERYDNGLAKLLDTTNQVNDMQIYLEDLQPKLKEATIETDLLLEKITLDRSIANEQNIIVEKDTLICDQQAKEAQILKDSCENDLAIAIPALEAAESALKNLSKADIVEIKAMLKPPLAIKMTMAAICIMLDVKPDKKSMNSKGGDNRIDPYWIPATKEVLNDPKFLNRLQTYNRDNISNEIINKIVTFTSDPEFNPENIAKRGSNAAAGLCRWVHALYQYDQIARNIAPKRAALKDAEATLKSAQELLSNKQKILKEIIDKVNALEVSLNEAEAKKLHLKTQVNDCEAKLKRAEKLIKGLSSEKDRWIEMSKSLDIKYNNVIGDILLAAGAIAYLGAFTMNYRDEAIKQWIHLLKQKGITCSDDFNLRDTLGNPVTIRSWIIAKLPNDSFSIDNAIMTFTSNRWPLMIDPQGQANKWIKKFEENNSLKVVKQTQGNFIRTIENAIQFGNPVLIENITDSIDPILEPILLKQVVITNNLATIRLGDSTIEYDKNFRLYLTTKLRNPHYPPELCVKVNLLNFMATSEGLTDQMLGKVIAIEHRELELQRQSLIIEDAENQKQLKDIENKILILLKNAQGNILDDEVLIDTLEDSKKTSNTITEKVKQSETTQIRITKFRQGYIPVANQTSLLFFIISDLITIDPMYQYSLDWYINLFETSIDTAEKSKILEDRLKYLNENFLYLLYKNICKSLFEKDKLLFSFLLVVNINMNNKLLTSNDVRFFLQGNISMEITERNPYPQWLSDKSWLDVLGMIDNVDNMKSFKSFFTEVISENKWTELLDSTNPLNYLNDIISDYLSDSTNNLNNLNNNSYNYDRFKRLCIIRCLRPDYIIPSIQDYISNELGSKFIESPTMNLKDSYLDSKSFIPLIFVLTPGAAPMTELFNLADELGYSNKLLAISLGQGQGPIAENAIMDAIDKGTWVCLQNCHLSISWLPTLEKICEEFNEETNHPNFRLWLTSEPSNHFPSYVLQNGIKMTVEPPKGMRANLLGSLSQIDSQLFNNSKKEFKKILYGLCFFHAIVRERKKFGPLGWNIQYIFSSSDLKISIDQLNIFINNSSTNDNNVIPFSALSYLVGECNYGGRVTDDKDRRCILNILDDYYNIRILEDSYKFSPSGIYSAPDYSFNTLDMYKEVVKNLPYNEGPEIFGLHDNANITCALNETNLLLDTVLNIQTKNISTSSGSNDSIVIDLCIDIENKLPSNYDIEKVLLQFPVRYNESMNTVLVQELIRFNKLLVIMKSSLFGLQKAIKGLVVMSDSLEQMLLSMSIGKVPSNWSKAAYPSLKPLGSWVNDLLDRLAFLQEWIDRGESPCVYWVSGFYFIQAFITGTLQNFARKHSIPIDKAEFDYRILTPTEMTIANTEKPLEGAYIRGLYMEGARWDSDQHIISESYPRELYMEMPYIHLFPKERSLVPLVKGIPEHYTGSVYGTASVYMCPVYKTSLRQGVLSTTGHSTNFVMFIRIPMNKNMSQKHWIKRGVALLTQLDT